MSKEFNEHSIGVASLKILESSGRMLCGGLVDAAVQELMKTALSMEGVVWQM